MKRFLLAFGLLLFGLEEVWSQPNVDYTTIHRLRLIKRGYTGDWAGSQSDTNNNQGLNYNSLKLDLLLRKVFGTDLMFTQAFKDSVANFGTGVVTLGTTQSISGLKTFTQSVRDSQNTTGTATSFYGLNSGTGVVTWQLQRTGGTASNWNGKLPNASTNFVLNSGATEFTFTAAGTLTVPGNLNANAGSFGTPLALSSGGTQANLTASNGGIFYSTATTGAILSGTATAGQMLQSGATAAPAWSTATYPATATGTGTILRADGTNWLATTATYPATTTINQLLYSSSANAVVGLATANNSVLVTDGTGIPSIGSTLPVQVQGGITHLGTIEDSVVIKDVNLTNKVRIAAKNNAGTNRNVLEMPTDVNGKTWTFPSLTGIVALGNAGQDFTNVGNITANGTVTATAGFKAGAATLDDGVITFYNAQNANRLYLQTSIPAPATDELAILLPPSAGTLALKADSMKYVSPSYSNSGSFFSTIQAAINNSGSGTLVVVYPGTYNESITLKNGVDLYFLPNAKIVRTSVASGSHIFTDGGAAVSCKIYGALSLNISGIPAVTQSTFVLYHGGTGTIYFEFNDATLTNYSFVNLDGTGTQYVWGFSVIQTRTDENNISLASLSSSGSQFVTVDFMQNTQGTFEELSPIHCSGGRQVIQGKLLRGFEVISPLIKVDGGIQETQFEIVEVTGGFGGNLLSMLGGVCRIFSKRFDNQSSVGDDNGIDYQGGTLEIYGSLTIVVANATMNSIKGTGNVKVYGTVLTNRAKASGITVQVGSLLLDSNVQ